MPTYVVQPSGSLALDSYLQKATPDERQGFSEELKFGDEAGAGTTRALIELPLRAIPAGAAITTGTQLEIEIGAFPAAPMSNSVAARLARRFDQPTATWNEFKDGGSWSAAGGDVAVIDPPEVAFTVPTSGKITISGTAFEAMVQDALDKRGGLLVLLLRSDAAETDTVTCRSGQHTDRSLAPKLTVVTTETDLGHAYRSVKRAVSSWIAAGQQPIRGARYLAIGDGVTPSSDWETRRRLKGEVYRVPIAGTSLDIVNRRSEVWGIFPAGKGVGSLTEVAVFASDTTKLIDDCEKLSGWSASHGTLQLETVDHREGGAAVEMDSVPFGTNRTLTRTGLSIDLSKYNLDDYFAFWLFGTVGAPSLSPNKVVLTDENGTWEWNNKYVAFVWLNYLLRFKDADVQPAGVSGPGKISQFQFSFDNSSTVTIRFDHLRAYRSEEDILAVAPLSVSKTITQNKRFAVRFAAKRSTN